MILCHVSHFTSHLIMFSTYLVPVLLVAVLASVSAQAPTTSKCLPMQWESVLSGKAGLLTTSYVADFVASYSVDYQAKMDVINETVYGPDGKLVGKYIFLRTEVCTISTHSFCLDLQLYP